MKEKESKWVQLFWSFFKIGLFSYGGFMSMIAFSKKEVVDKNHFVSEEDFQNGIAYVSLLPGPTALNFCGYIGFLFLGNIGMFLAVFAASLPSIVLLWLIAWLYHDGFSPEQITPYFKWIPFGIASIILHTGINLLSRHPYAKKWFFTLITFLLFVLSPVGTTLTLIILIVAVTMYHLLTASNIRSGKLHFNGKIVFASVLIIAIILIPMQGLSHSPIGDFLKISKYSLGLLGGGYVFIPLMDDLLVNVEAWLPSNVFYDGIAFGQITPGPIMISMFFFGYYVHGAFGAFMYFLGIVLLPMIITRFFAHSFRSLISNSLLKNTFSFIRLVVLSAILFSAWDIFSKSINIENYMNLSIGIILTGGLFALQHYKIFNVFHVIGTCILIGIIFAG
ncbi:MAG: chromate transporter [Cyclobacteriaceae bacterium]